jgi:hypothetical protein
MRVGQIEVADGQRRDFGRAGTGVIEEEEDRVVAETLPGRTVGCVEYRIHLGFFEVAHGLAHCLLEGNPTDLAAPREMFRAAFADVAGKRVDGC